MFVQTVLNLIEILKSDEKLSESDGFFFEKFEKQIAKRDALDYLTEKEVSCLVNYYKERWNYGVGVDDVGKLKSQKVNEYWIVFANELEASTIKIQKKTVHPCWSVLLSLLTTHFDIYPFTGKTISLWDRHNSVFPEAARMYEALFPCIQSNDRKQVECMYDKIMETIIIPANKDTGFITNQTRYDSTSKWLEKVEKGTLFQHGFYWFESEVFLIALLDYKSNYVEVNNKMKMFLDQLIQTYSQEKDELLKLVRVNLKFNDMMKGLKFQIQDDILMQIGKYEDLGTKENFITNSIAFINKRLLEVGFTHYKDTNHFFSPSLCCEKVLIPLCPDALEHVGDVIEGFKKALDSVNFSKNPTAYKRVVDYLTELSRPILSDLEKEGAVLSYTMRDYLGSQT